MAVVIASKIFEDDNQQPLCAGGGGSPRWKWGGYRLARIYYAKVQRSCQDITHGRSALRLFCVLARNLCGNKAESVGVGRLHFFVPFVQTMAVDQ